MHQSIYRYDNINDLIQVLPTDLPVTHKNWSSLILPPGVYQYNASKYDMTAEGLYGILSVNIDGGWRIIYENDPYALMSAFSWLVAYGRMDESWTNAQLTERAKTTKLSLKCERTADWIMYLLASQCISARKCRLLTAEDPNGWDEGHVCVEIYHNKAWKFFDSASNFYPVGDWHMSLVDYIKHPDAKKVFIADGERDLLGSGSNRLHTNVIYDMIFRTRKNLDKWVSRIFQIPGIVHTDGKTYFYLPPGTESRKNWVLELDPNYKVISYDTWMGMFY